MSKLQDALLGLRPCSSAMKKRETIRRGQSGRQRRMIVVASSGPDVAPLGARGL